MSRISFLHDMLASVFARGDSSDTSHEAGSFTELADALLSERGEMSGNRLARGILGRFEAAGVEERLAFFELLATRFDINAAHALRAAERYAEEPSAMRLAILGEAVEPGRLELLRRLNRAPGATVRLVRMREALLGLVPEHPDLARIDLDFRHLFRSWFNRGFLVLREIDWSTPANILEKIIAYEAVHEIESWAALRARLEPSDRRCFAFFHPAMPDEPLIFVEVALTRSSPSTVREVLWPDRLILEAEEVDTAVFYSISNCQKGLAGVSFGNFLIKQVASELSRELPQLNTFRTLSPIPGFMRWVNARAEALDEASSEGAAVPADGERIGVGGADHEKAEADTVPLDDELRETLALARRVAESEELVIDEDEQRRLRRLVAHYLAREKRSDGQPLDPVARFHLGNGASLDDVLPGADVFRKALAQSAGAMVSYLYDLDRIEANHEVYAGSREVVLSDGLGSFLGPRRSPRKRA